ncbi:hypothetical protein Pcinc_015038 [Petrolisthes cinctipes]|uniref:FLYWCH-type domain-containing protein n=1 Tax=Petrolisthes cinctipes TaxID=88211 RepID=A0AAE1KSL0_PETCI|nr:hypothetical protein Pcinc_015038 [Petrolisthes cinctipes]
MSTDSFTEISVACNPSEYLTIEQPSTSTIDDPSEELTQPSPLPFFNVSLPVEEYVKKRVASVSTSWIWSIHTKKNRCLASVSQQGNIFTRRPKEHNHGGNPGAKLRAQAIFLVKAAAREDTYKSSGKIVTDTLMTLTTDEVQLPKVSNLQRTANRARQQLRPKHPTDLEFEIVTAHNPK